MFLKSFLSFLQEIFIRWSTDKKWTEAGVRDRWIRRNRHWQSRSVTEIWKLLSSSESCYHSSGQKYGVVCGRKAAHERASSAGPENAINQVAAMCLSWFAASGSFYRPSMAAGPKPSDSREIIFTTHPLHLSKTDLIRMHCILRPGLSWKHLLTVLPSGHREMMDDGT